MEGVEAMLKQLADEFKAQRMAVESLAASVERLQRATTENAKRVADLEHMPVPDVESSMERVVVADSVGAASSVVAVAPAAANAFTADVRAAATPWDDTTTSSSSARLQVSDVIPDSTAAAAASSTTDTELSIINGDAPATCSTKCRGCVRDSTTPAGVRDSNQEASLVLDPVTVHAAASSTAHIESSTIGRDTPFKCSMKCLSHGVNVVAPSAVCASSITVPNCAVAITSDINFTLCSVNRGESTRCSIKCPSTIMDVSAPVLVYVDAKECVAKHYFVAATTKTISFGFLPHASPTNLSIMTNSKCALTCPGDAAGAVSTHKVYDGLIYVLWVYNKQQPWPPPIQLKCKENGAKVRPMPWPSFMSVGCSMSWHVSVGWKPPWPSLGSSSLRALSVLANVLSHWCFTSCVHHMGAVVVQVKFQGCSDIELCDAYLFTYGREKTKAVRFWHEGSSADAKCYNFSLDIMLWHYSFFGEILCYYKYESDPGGDSAPWVPSHPLDTSTFNCKCSGTLIFYFGITFVLEEIMCLQSVQSWSCKIIHRAETLLQPLRIFSVKFLLRIHTSSCCKFHSEDGCLMPLPGWLTVCGILLLAWVAQTLKLDIFLVISASFFYHQNSGKLGQPHLVLIIYVAQQLSLATNWLSDAKEAADYSGNKLQFSVEESNITADSKFLLNCQKRDCMAWAGSSQGSIDILKKEIMCRLPKDFVLLQVVLLCKGNLIFNLKQEAASERDSKNEWCRLLRQVAIMLNVQ